MQVLEPIWKNSLIRDTYSSIKGRGVHDGVNRIKKALKDKGGTKYCLKMDIKKYYPSIDNEILKSVIRKKIKDLELLWLLDEIIDSTEGVPIGNYLSQYFGNLYLSGYDHYMKEQNKIKYYFRYCDDILMLHSSKDYLHFMKNRTKMYLKNYLKLELKSNWQIFPIASRGIDFLGYKFFHDCTLLRDGIKFNFIKKTKNIKLNWYRLNKWQIINGIMSYYGWLKYCNCGNLMNKYIDKEIFWIVEQVSKDSGISNPLRRLV